MKHLKTMSESIDLMKNYHIYGVSPETNLMKKINELIELVNKLENRVKELENK